MMGFWIFLIGVIFGFAGWEDYHTRGGSDDPYPWEDAINHFSTFLIILGILMMILKGIEKLSA